MQKMRTCAEISCQHCARDGVEVRGSDRNVWKGNTSQNAAEFWQGLSKR